MFVHQYLKIKWNILYSRHSNSQVTCGEHSLKDTDPHEVTMTVTQVRFTLIPKQPAFLQYLYDKGILV